MQVALGVGNPVQRCLEENLGAPAERLHRPSVSRARAPTCGQEGAGQGGEGHGGLGTSMAETCSPRWFCQIQDREASSPGVAELGHLQPGQAGSWCVWTLGEGSPQKEVEEPSAGSRVPSVFLSPHGGPGLVRGSVRTQRCSTPSPARGLLPGLLGAWVEDSGPTN